MEAFDDILARHFRYYGAVDALPFGVRPRKNRQDGRVLLARVMRDMGLDKGVEVGVQYGHSAKTWCENNPELHLTCIDPYSIYRARRSQEKQDSVYEQAQRNLAGLNVTFLRERSLDAVDRFDDGSLGFVHIDGDHSFDACVQDIIRWVPKVRKGGMVLIHDYVAFYLGGVRDAVDGYTRNHVIRKWFVTHDQTPTVFWQKGEERV